MANRQLQARRPSPSRSGDADRTALLASPHCWVHPVIESGCFLDSVDLAGDRGMGVPAGRSVLGRGAVAQGRVTSVVVFVFEVADHDAGLEQGVPVVSVEALLPKPVVERFDVAVVPWLSG